MCRFPLLLAFPGLVAALRSGDEELEGGGWQLWSPEQCDLCRDTSVSELAGPNSYALGCIEDHAAVPPCDVDASSENPQAGGHIGTFHVLNDGKVAKHSMAFDKGAPQGKREAAATEWGVYMELWCLQRLGSEAAGRHWLRPFALGRDPWAPRFFGMCRLGDAADEGHKLFLVMENLFQGYSKVSQLDLKVGITVEPDEKKFSKKLAQNLISEASPTSSDSARLAGYKIWEPQSKSYAKMWRKDLSPLQSLDSVFQKLLLDPRKASDLGLLVYYGDRLQDLYTWWATVGEREFRAVAASLLFVFEGDEAALSSKPLLKFIDFAHFYPRKLKPSWPSDGVAAGIASAMYWIDSYAEKVPDGPAKQEEQLGKRDEACDIVKGTCDFKCAKNLTSTGSTKYPWTLGDAKGFRCVRVASKLGYRFVSISADECRMCSDLSERDRKHRFGKNKNKWKVLKIRGS